MNASSITNILKSIIFTCAIFPSLIQASTERKDIELSNGRILESAKILNTSPSDAVVAHKGGVENIKWELFPPDIKKDNGFQKSTAKEYRENSKQQSLLLAERSQARRLVFKQLSDIKEQRVEAHVEVIQVVENGILAKGYGLSNPRKEKVTNYSTRVKGSGLYPKEKITTANTRTVEKRDRIIFPDFIFIEIDIFDLGRFVDGSKVIINAYPSGTYSYTTVMGGGKTIRKYTHGIFGLLNQTAYKKAGGKKGVKRLN